jgi:hypothetical protein
MGVTGLAPLTEPQTVLIQSAHCVMKLIVILAVADLASR